MPLFFLELLVVLNLKNFLAAVIAASLTSTVAQNNLAALGALCHAGESELPVVRTSLISARLGYFSLWYCHNYTSLKRVKHNFPLYKLIFFVIVKQGFKNCKPWVDLFGRTAAISFTFGFSALRTKPGTILLAK